ncbi:RNA polymerase sigma factor [Embleya scabrispora]|uniref:RNA polymerase sigma factor n=1 Tax=Embleya scabrispora TaxID=159449 RepID=UPI00137525A8|nr:sigma-70 family RNA polymerase sigma factor [Embleya scabrispora]
MENRHDIGAPPPPGRLRALHHEGFTELYRRHWLAVLRYTSRRVRPHERAEDVASRVFVTALEKGDVIFDIDEDERLPYLLGIARNHLLTDFRSEDRSVRLRERIELEQAVRGNAEPDGTAIVDTQLEVARAFDELPELHREVMSLVAFEDLSIPQVALVMDQSEASIRRIVTRARQLLRVEMSRTGSKEPGHARFGRRVGTS